MLGIMANSRRVASAPPAYDAQAVYFDGTNDWLKRTGALSGPPTNNKTILLSMWFQNDFSGTEYYFLGENSGNTIVVSVYVTSTAFTIYCKSASGFNILSIQVAKANFSTLGWNHVLFSADVTQTQTTMKFYANGVSSTMNVISYFNDTILWDASQDWGIGGRGFDGAVKIERDMAESYITNEYLDLSIQANREKFILNGAPVDLGTTGATPTGTQPLIYMKGNAASWNAGTNAGSGGNFTMTGAVTDSVNEPVELP